MRGQADQKRGGRTDVCRCHADVDPSGKKNTGGDVKQHMREKERRMVVGLSFGPP